MPSKDRFESRRTADRVASAVILCLLALVGAAVYLKGQHAPAATPYAAGGEAPAPPRLRPAETLLGSHVLASTETFTADTLYEYINGQAPFYIEYGFAKLLVANYEADDAPPLAIDLYDMAARRNAYGIFTDTFPPEDAPADIGNSGYVSGNMAGFWRGSYFVKVRALTDHDAENLVRDAAAVAAGWIEDDRATLAQFDAFPEADRIEGSLAFVKSSAFGLGHFRETFVADYLSDDQRYRLFFCELDAPAHARDLLTTHADTLEEPVEGTTPDQLWGEVEYVGPMYLIAKDNLVAGCLGIAERPTAEGKAAALLERALDVAGRDGNHARQ
jgi:hypothetical protein